MPCVCRRGRRNFLERRDVVHKLARTVSPPAVMKQPVRYDKITRPDDPVIPCNLFERLGAYAHVRRLAFHHQARRARPVVRDQIRSTGHALVLEVHLHGDQRRGIAALPDEKMQKMHAHPFLWNEAHVFFPYGIENVSGTLVLPRPDMQGTGREIQPGETVCVGQSSWITVMLGTFLGRLYRDPLEPLIETFCCTISQFFSISVSSPLKGAEPVPDRPKSKT